MIYSLSAPSLFAGFVQTGPTVTFARRISVRGIQAAVAEHYGIAVAEMTSQRRSRSVARPRQVAMYLAKRLTPKSLPDIGRLFGGRDHTTVIHAIRQIETLSAVDGDMANDIDMLAERVGGSIPNYLPTLAYGEERWTCGR